MNTIDESLIPSYIPAATGYSAVGSAPGLGPGGRGFEPLWPDQNTPQLRLGVFCFGPEHMTSVMCEGARTPERCSVTRRNREAVPSPRGVTTTREARASPSGPTKNPPFEVDFCLMPCALDFFRTFTLHEKEVQHRGKRANEEHEHHPQHLVFEVTAQTVNKHP